MTLDLLEEQAEAQVRRVWHDGRWFFSVIDVIGLLTSSSRPRKYWNDLKMRLTDEGAGELSAKIGQLKMTAADGKQRLTDAADTETLLRLVQSVPSPKAEPLKRWLARLGTERLEEIENPAQAADRLRTLYKQHGYSDEWIDQRMQGIIVRDELTSEWRERGAEEGREFAILTDILHRETFAVSTDEHKVIKHLRKRENLRDNMTHWNWHSRCSRRPHPRRSIRRATVKGLCNFSETHGGQERSLALRASRLKQRAGSRW